MKVSALQQNCNNRRTNSFRSGGQQTLDQSGDGVFKTPTGLFWLVLHGLCCIISLVLGFRFSRLIFFLLFSTNSTTTTTTTNFIHQTTPIISIHNRDTDLHYHLQSPPSYSDNAETHHFHNRTTISRVVAGRHGIRIRPWPHPDPHEVMKAHLLIERVQIEQRLLHGIKNPRAVIAITPTYVRTFQTLHLTGLMHTLMLVPFDLVWIVVEAGGISNETSVLLSKSRLRVVHVGFDENMPDSLDGRHGMESRMRLEGLRVVREKMLDGIIMFADDSNMHSLELFDEIQSVQWMGAVSVGILAHPGRSDASSQKQGAAGNGEIVADENREENMPVPIQGPACNTSGQLAGWHTFNSLLYAENSARYIDDGATVLPMKLEWAGFVLNSRLVWKDADNKPEWVQDFDGLLENGKVVESPLALLKDSSFIEPLGKCGRKVLIWWLRVEARADSKFPRWWIIDPPLEIVVPAKHTPWPDAPPELASAEREATIEEHTEEHTPKTGKIPRSRHGARSKRKHEAYVNIRVSEISGRNAEER